MDLGSADGSGYVSVMGVPAIRSDDLAEALVEGLTNGIPLRQLCRENGVSKSAVYNWFDADPELQGRIERARARGYHEIADSTIEIADDLDEDPASRRVRIETRLKLLAKWDPRRYGDKIAHVGGDEGDAPIRLERVERVVIDPRGQAGD